MASNHDKSTNDEEQSLLAAIGSTVANVDTYETSVLRQATLNSAPILTGVGFPDLSPLAPSFDARRGQLVGSADAQHAQTLLSRLRGELSKLQGDGESQRSLVLRAKEQILLVYFQSVAGVPPHDLPVDPLLEASKEQRRSQRLLDQDGNGSNKKRKHITKTDGTEARSVASSSVTASFGKQALLERNERPIKRRATMMRQKQNSQEPNEEDEELKKRLHQRRKEREERRRIRRQQWESDDDSEEEQEFTFDGKQNDVSAKPEAATMNGSSKDIVTEASTANLLICPICEELVEGGDTQEESDAKLSLHMQDCQQSGRITRRRPRGGRAMSNRDASTGTEPVMGNKTTNKKSTKPLKARKQPAPTWKVAVDDFDEWDYEDRVDDWIINGRNNMREMAERDESEDPPGAVAYSEGLVVPGWINNRLFPYQRTGLQWMWDLHLQEAGGVVGDEMGLGKTVQVCAFLGAMAASRKIKSILIIAPATMLQHWLSELSIWAPGLRRILIHKSGESDGSSRNITLNLLRNLDKWLRTVRANRVNEAIDEEDFDEFDADSFCGTGYVVVTTYESIRRSPDIWTGHNWSYVVMDEGQKIRNPDADVTIACKVRRRIHGSMRDALSVSSHPRTYMHSACELPIAFC